MFDPQKISLGRVHQAYGLNGYDIEKVIGALWPNAISPLALWLRAHELHWRHFAASNQAVFAIESPALPEIDWAAKYFHAHLLEFDIMSFFRKLSLNIPAKTLREGLNFILEETYEDIDAIFPEEREFLFSTLSRLEKINIYEQYSPDSELFEEKILSLPISSYHFISYIFSDTIIVDKIAAIHYWSVVRNYPLKQEVKGITHDLVKDVVKRAAEGTPLVPEAAPPLDEPAAETQSLKQEGMTLIPRALWEGKKGQQVCDDMRVAGYEEDTPIAHALYYWAGIKNFTKIGTILRGEDITESARDKHARKHLKLAEGRYYTE